MWSNNSLDAGPCKCVYEEYENRLASAKKSVRRAGLMLGCGLVLTTTGLGFVPALDLYMSSLEHQLKATQQYQDLEALSQHLEIISSLPLTGSVSDYRDLLVEKRADLQVVIGRERKKIKLTKDALFERYGIYTIVTGLIGSLLMVGGYIGYQVTSATKRSLERSLERKRV